MTPADAYLVALTRVSGIVAGVVLMLLLSMVVFPKSASHQVRLPAGALWQQQWAVRSNVSAEALPPAIPFCVGGMDCDRCRVRHSACTLLIA